jgi:hypothetical protein
MEVLCSGSEVSSQVPCDWLNLAGFGIQCLLFAGLVWYTLETRRMRKEGQRQADAAMESLKLLKVQSEQKDAQELARVLFILNDMQSNLMFWMPIAKDQWGTAPETVKLLPDDWSSVFYQAGKASIELRTEVQTIQKHLTEANLQIARFLSKPPNCRDPSLMPTAYANLQKAAPLLSKAISRFEAKLG